MSGAESGSGTKVPTIPVRQHRAAKRPKARKLVTAGIGC